MYLDKDQLKMPLCMIFFLSPEHLDDLSRIGISTAIVVLIANHAKDDGQHSRD